MRFSNRPAPVKGFHERLVQLQSSLAADLDSERLPERIMETIRDLMRADNVLVVGVDGRLLGKWWVHNSGWQIRNHSMDVVRKALNSTKGYWKSELEGNASESQELLMILSCLAAKMDVGNRTIGAVYCDIRKGERRFSEEDGVNLKLLADCFAVYVRYFDFYCGPEDQQESAPLNMDSLLGETKIIKNLKTEIAGAAKLPVPVLLLGDTGVGKEIVARLLHDLSDRAANEFVPVHCAAISRDLFESELFGHEKGAFSGAYRKRAGLVLKADGGTLFLDEVGDIPLDKQVKLLRLLEDKKVRPVGSDVELGPVDFRLVGATNKNLKEMVREKTFREDLFYRISGIPIRVPALKERLEDIALLANHFASPKKLTDEAIALLQSVQDWPGNVRQLKTVVENARNLAEGYVITRDGIEKQLDSQQISSAGAVDFYELKMQWEKGTLPNEELERTLTALYANAGNNWNEVARQLGLLSPAEIRTFRNWVYYLQRKRILKGISTTAH